MENEPVKPKILSREQAAAKAEYYCAYQERSQHEMRSKLYEWGLHRNDAEELISQLIANDFLNEKRFALAYALGKLRIKSWGKRKISQGLKLKRVPDKMIREVLQSINDAEYNTALLALIRKKSKTIAEKNPYKKHYKLMQYAISKGYEPDMIRDILNSNQLS